MGVAGAGEAEAQVRVLVVDDSSTIRWLLRNLLKQGGYEPREAADLASARALLSEESFDLLIVDKNLPDGSGLALAEAAVTRTDAAEVILITGDPSLDSAVDALRWRVADYLVKPFGEPAHVLSRIHRVVEVQRLKQKNRRLLAELETKNAELERLVVRDSLTHLYNHGFLQQFIEKELRRCERTGEELTLILLDIDHFKSVNDQLGHPTGDEILRALAKTLQIVTRASDYAFHLSSESIAARYGGDEFALVLPSTTRAGGAIVAERLRTALQEAPLWQGQTVTLSAGIATFPADARDRQALIAASDAALLAAKRGGRNRAVAFSPSLLDVETGAGAQEQRRVSEALDRTIVQRAFSFVYQPIQWADGRGVLAYEALCRPSDAAFAGPQELFSAAERCGRVLALGKSLRQSSVAPMPQLAEPALLFLNIHPSELGPELLDASESEILPWAKRVVLEITESAAIHGHALVKAAMQRLRAAGFRMAVDDLGAGYAGLNSISLLEPDFIKLDLSILKNAQSDRRAMRLVQHLLDFANGEGILVIAEGIETPEDYRAALELKCHLLQGYLTGRPAPTFDAQTRLPQMP